MYPYKVFIGTLFSGEGEFERCKSILDKQVDADIVHYIVDNKPILEACEEMYSTWSRVNNDFDIFIQVDADMVLKNSNTVFTIAKTLCDSEYNHISYPVFDHLSNHNIWALNAYLPSVVFPTLKNKYKPDMEFIKGKKYPNITLNNEFMAHHAETPTTKQAFHYGWHRQLRIVKSPGQKIILKNLYNAPSNIYRSWAIAGAEYAKKHLQATQDFSPIEYTNNIFIENYRTFIKDQV